ncbi:mitochondria-eating protein isoform X2 [Takifugu flavidus]|uniref:Mitochondria-eating protein n=1 Tax=Takifugu flavidus TaxID=433684 RepID=A0A5C6MRZ8_9TELE|nr:mitochondria-eating protein isoform X2 [Takifugu flavidus]TWW57575.1 Mitochondria-eating protein [Takifugu flavidus]
MADALRRLTNASSFSLLQDKLESWQRDYRILSCDQNLNKCCELIELTTSIQSQLFAVLNITAAEGGHFDGVDTLKTRLLPWLGTCFSVSRPSVTHDTSLQLIQESVEKDRKIRELSVSHDNQMQKLDAELGSTRLQLESVKAAMAGVQEELDETKSKSATALLASEDEISRLKAELHAAHEQLEVYERKLSSLDDYERRIRLLREEFSYLSTEKSTLHERLTRSHSPSSLSRLGRCCSSRRSESPTRAQLTSSSRHTRLISRFNGLYAGERLEAQALLLRYIDDLETVQRIIFIAVAESFKAAKLAYRQFKLRTRKTLSATHFGPESLEDASVDYIVRNLDLYDVETSINVGLIPLSRVLVSQQLKFVLSSQDVISAMNVNPQISFPPEVDFVLIGDLITETCKVAFAMQTLDPPLDISFASDGELYNDSRYRRSYDSEFTAPLVRYHVWPTLVEGDAVLIKGEAVTRRAAVWARGRSRSASPVRSHSLSPTRTLALNGKRSLSPDRLREGYL